MWLWFISQLITVRSKKGVNKDSLSDFLIYQQSDLQKSNVMAIFIFLLSKYEKTIHSDPIIIPFLYPKLWSIYFERP